MCETLGCLFTRERESECACLWCVCVCARACMWCACVRVCVCVCVQTVVKTMIVADRNDPLCHAKRKVFGLFFLSLGQQRVSLSTCAR